MGRLFLYESNGIANNKFRGDHMTVGAQLKQTIASLKGARSTLDTYSLQSIHPQEKERYKNGSIKLDCIIERLESRLSSLEWEEPQYKGF
jgi:hypothetical protein